MPALGDGLFETVTEMVAEKSIIWQLGSIVLMGQSLICQSSIHLPAFTIEIDVRIERLEFVSYLLHGLDI